MTLKPLFALAPLALLVACGDPEPEAEVAAEEGGEVAGDVLGGTISDDMIPLDQLTSTSPPAERNVSSEDGASSSEPASAPASTPQPEVESQEAEPAAADPAPPVAAPLE